MKRLIKTTALKSMTKTLGASLGLLSAKNGEGSSCRRAIRRCLLGFIVAPGVMLFSNAGTAAMITIPWTVGLFIPSGAVIPPFDASYTALDFSPPFGPDRLGLNFVSNHEHSYTVHLPFEINISAPDHVSPGQFVTLESSAVLAGTPIFTTAGGVEFNTRLFADADSFPLGIPGLVDEISFGGVSLTIAGERSYTATDTSADEKFTRTIWKNDPFGNPLQLVTAERFEGYELQTTGDEDAWGTQGLQLLEFAANFAPPPVGAAFELASAIIDLTVTLELDIIEDTYLTTQFVTGFYTDDGGATYDDFLINGADRRGWLTIPDTLTPGETYEIQMTAMGLGFTALFDYLLQGNLDIEHEILSGIYNVDIAEIPLSDPFLVASWADRFQYVEFLTDFLSMDDFLAASLSFEIIDGLGDQDPTLTAPPWEAARIDPLIGTLIGTGANPGQQSYEFPGDPPSAIVVITAVPEPSTLILFTVGLLGLGFAGVSRSMSKKSR